MTEFVKENSGIVILGMILTFIVAMCFIDAWVERNKKL
jgi:hypothetical protein